MLGKIMNGDQSDLRDVFDVETVTWELGGEPDPGAEKCKLKGCSRL
jgi:hypothetical protein